MSETRVIEVAGSLGLDALIFEVTRAAELQDKVTEDHDHERDGSNGGPSEGCVPCEVCDRVHFVLVALKQLREKK